MELPLDLSLSEGCVGLLRGGSLGLRLSVEQGLLRCREIRTNAVVPILTPTSPVSDLSVFRAFLKDCRFSFQLRRGLKLAVKGRGGGCGNSRKKPDVTAPTINHEVTTEIPTNSALCTQPHQEIHINPEARTYMQRLDPPVSHPKPALCSQPHQEIHITPEIPPLLQLLVQSQAHLDVHICPPPHITPAAAVEEEIFDYSLKKDRSSEHNQERALKIAQEVLTLAQQGRVVGMALAELEDLPMVTVLSPLPVAMKLLEALHQEPLWALSANYMVRASIARLARKFFMDHLFLSNSASFESTSAEINQALREITEFARQKDTTWPESGTLCQLSLINNLAAETNKITAWQKFLHAAVPTIFDVYTSSSPLTILPLASQVYRFSLVGAKNLAESQVVVDTMYVALREKSEGTADVLDTLFKLTKGWKGIYSLLACLEWGLQRNLVTSELVQPFTLI